MTKRQVVVRMQIGVTVSIPDKVPEDRKVEFAYKKISRDLTALVESSKGYDDLRVDLDPKLKKIIG